MIKTLMEVSKDRIKKNTKVFIAATEENRVIKDIAKSAH